MSCEVLGLVVGRSGSKGIPGKNTQLLAGRPMVDYTFLAARSSLRLSRTIVSSDDRALIARAKAFGIEVPFVRPSRLATDESPIIDTALHAIQWLREQANYRPNYVMLLQPTSPLRTAEDIDRAIELACQRKANAVVGVTPSSNHPHWTKRIDPDGYVVPFIAGPETSAYMRQQLPPAYKLNGALFMVRSKVLAEKKTWCPEEAVAYVMPSERSLDIDSPWDLRFADFLLRETEAGPSPVSREIAHL